MATPLGTQDDIKDAESKANIFGGGTSPDQAVGGGLQPGVQIASAEGDISSGSGGDYPAIKSAMATNIQPATSAASQGRAITAGAQDQKAPVDPNQLTSSISQASQKLQDQANQQVTAAKSPYAFTAQTQGDVDKALKSGDLNADVFQRYRSAATAPTADLTADQVDTSAIANEGALANTYKSRANDPEYTSGMARLDAAALGKNAAFKQGQAQALAAANQYGQQQSTIGDTTNAALTQGVADSSASYKKAMADYLATLPGQLRDTYSTQKRNFDNELYSQTHGAAGDEALSNIRQTAVEQLKREHPELAKAFAAGNYLPAGWESTIQQNYSPGSTDYQAFMSPEDVMEYNTAQNVLGTGDALGPNAGSYYGKTPGDVGTFTPNMDALKAYILGGVQKVKAKQDAEAAEAKEKADAIAKAKANTAPFADAYDAGGATFKPMPTAAVPNRVQVETKNIGKITNKAKDAVTNPDTYRSGVLNPNNPDIKTPAEKARDKAEEEAKKVGSGVKTVVSNPGSVLSGGGRW